MLERLKKASIPFALVVVLSAVPACPAYADNDLYWSGLFASLDTMYEEMESQDTHLNNIQSYISSISDVYLANINTDLATNNSLIRTTNDYLTLIYNRLGTINTNITDNVVSKLTSIYNKLNNIDSSTTDIDTTLALVYNAIENYQIPYLSDIYSTLSNIYTYGIPSNTVIPSINIPNYTNQLNTIIALLSMPDANALQALIGNFDALQFADDVGDLVDEVANLAPFGAITVLSSEINLLATISPPDHPVMSFAFNFGGNNNVSIDLSWLDGLKPAINFVTIFMLLYCLGIVTLKFVRNEATS